MEPFVRPKRLHISLMVHLESYILHNVSSSSGDQGFPAFSAGCALGIELMCFSTACSALTTSTWLQLSLAERTSPVSGFTPSASSSSISFAQIMSIKIPRYVFSEATLKESAFCYCFSNAQPNGCLVRHPRYLHLRVP